MPDDSRLPLDLYDAAVRDTAVAARIVELSRARPQWIHSIVQSIDYRDDTTVHHDFTVDFTIPTDPPVMRLFNEPPAVLLPIALLPKGKLIAFQALDGSSCPTPFLSRRHTGAVAATILPLLANNYVRDPISAHLTRHLQETATDPYDGSAGDVGPWWQGRCTTCSQSDLLAVAVLSQFQEFTGLLLTLARNYMLILLLAKIPGERVVVSYSYDRSFRFAVKDDDEFVSDLDRYPEKPTLAYLFFRGIGWASTPVKLSTPTAAATRSYQLRISAPDGVEIVGASLHTHGPDGSSRSVDSTSGGFPMTQLQTSDCLDGPSHARVRFRSGRQGWLKFLASSGWATALLLAAGAWRLNEVEKAAVSAANHTDTIAVLAALLLGLTGLMASLLFRSSEHAMLRRMLSWLRYLSVGLGVLPLIAAATLIFGSPGQAPTIFWIVLAAVAVLLASVFTMSCLLPKVPRGGDVRADDWYTD